MATKHQTREFLCQAIWDYIHTFEARGVNIDSLVKDLPLSLAELKTPNCWTDWETGMQLHERVEQLAGGYDGMDQLVIETIPVSMSRFYGYFSKSLSPEFFYHVVITIFGPRSFPMLDPRLESVGKHKLKVTLRIPEDARPAEAFFRSAASVYRELPTICGCERATVEETVSSHEAEFIVSIPEYRSLFTRLAHFFSQDNREKLLVEMMRQQAEIQENFAKLQAAHKELEITTAQLRTAQKFETVGKLIGGIAHDFNNSLTIILSCSELLSQQSLDEDSTRFVKNIKSAVLKSSQLTQHLLAYSRRQILHPKVIDINELLDQLKPMVGSAVGEGIDFSFILSSDLGRIRVDPIQFEQVVINLILNAADAMNSSGKVTVETSNVDFEHDIELSHGRLDAGSYILIAVTDSGVGMEQDQLIQAFDPFYTTKDKGTGLGLAMVQGIIEQSSGGIAVYSEKHVGSVFKIYLPRVDEPAEAWVVEEEQLNDVSGSETILVVEDEPALLDLLSTTLDNHGYQVLVARNAKEALTITQRQSVDLVVSDVILPGLSGTELVELIREREPNMPIVFMSGYTENALLHRGELSGGQSLLAKPFSTNKLLLAIRLPLDKSRAPFQ
ncbi:MAG: response regulator [Pseudomonadales bacterium]|nr:response regulator [Pseudomonadales bacterium]